MFPGVLECHILKATGFLQLSLTNACGWDFSSWCYMYFPPSRFWLKSSSSSEHFRMIPRNVAGHPCPVHPVIISPQSYFVKIWVRQEVSMALWVVDLGTRHVPWLWPLTGRQHSSMQDAPEYLPCLWLSLCQNSDAPGHWHWSKDQCLTWSNPLQHQWPAEWPVARALSQIGSVSCWLMTG